MAEDRGGSTRCPRGDTLHMHTATAAVGVARGLKGPSIERLVTCSPLTDLDRWAATTRSTSPMSARPNPPN
jgi:hypothetical protein